MTNTDDTHIYVGSTKNLLKDRAWKHMNDCKHNRHRNRHVQALYNQLGPDDFEFDAVEVCATKAEARAAELRWVDYYKAASEWQLLNIATEDVSAASRNDDVKAKLSVARQSRTTKDITRARMKAAHQNRTRKSDPVYIQWQDGTETEFPSMNSAAKRIGVTSSMVAYWCKGERMTWKRPCYGIAEIRFL